MKDIDDVYVVFNEKLPDSMVDLLPDKYKLITFLNPFSMYMFKDYSFQLNEFTYIGADGILPIIINRIFGINKSNRFSFDMSSVGKAVFDYCQINQKSVYFIGSKQNQLESFINIFKVKYPNMILSGWNNGYFMESEFKSKVDEILRLKSDVVIIGMGTPKQELFALKLKEFGFDGAVYTCGGFIHQASEKFEYFNGFVDKFHIRWLYRIFKESYVLKRVLLYYPKFFVSYFWFLVLNSKKFK